MKTRRVISGQGLFAVIVWGASFVATRVALEVVAPSALVAIRLAAGTLLLVAFMKVRGDRVVPIRADVPICTLLGLVLGGHMLLQAHGLLHTSAMNTSWIIGFIPVTIAMGAQLLRQQRLSGMGWAGVLVGTGGVLLVTAVKPPSFENARIGDLLQMTSCLTWTFYTLAAAGPIVRNGVLSVTTFAAAVATAVAAASAAGTGLLLGPVTLKAVLAITFLGFVCSGVAYALWFAAVREHGPTRVGALLYIEPFVTLAVAASLLHEPITPNAVMGGMCVLGGVWLVARGSRQPTLATPVEPA